MLDLIIGGIFKLSAMADIFQGVAFKNKPSFAEIVKRSQTPSISETNKCLSSSHVSNVDLLTIDQFRP